MGEKGQASSTNSAGEVEHIKPNEQYGGPSIGAAPADQTNPKESAKNEMQKK